MDIFKGRAMSALSSLVNSPAYCYRLALAIMLLITPLDGVAQVSVLMQHNDIGRTGQNTGEKTLTPTNVTSSKFGQLFALPVDGQVYAQPLYVAGLQIPGSGTHNVLFVATAHDSVYAFDADSNGGSNEAPLWQASMLNAAHGAAAGATTVSSGEIADDIIPEYGITGTPVIDATKGILYVVSFTQEGASYVLRLHALSVTTGAETSGSPVTISAQVSGSGTGSSGGVLQLDSRWENQRSGLLLLNKILYITFASHADNGDWHGWILSYNPTTLAQISAYCTSPNGVGSGLWGGGDGLAADIVDPTGHPFGRAFVATGNGDYTAKTPYSNNVDYGDSMLNLDLANGKPTVQDEFTPYNQATLDSSDGDLGSGGTVVLPDQAGTYTHLLAQEGKGGTLYLINRDAMSGYNTSDKVVQEIISSSEGNGIWGGPAYWNENIYTGEAHRQLKAYSLKNGAMSAANASAITYGFPGPSPSVSSNGTAAGILWAVETDAYNTGGVAILQAYDATNLASVLYTSAQVPERDAAGPAVKFAVPTIANGKVYVGTGGEVNVYGLFSAQQVVASPVIKPGSSSFQGSLQVTITDSTPNSTIYYTTDGTEPSTTSTKYTGPITVNYSQTITAIATAPGYVWITPVSATYTALDQTANPTISPAAGTYSTSPTITMTDATSGASIYYTTDGSMPSDASTLYKAPFVVGGTETIRAIAFAPGQSGSAVVSQGYTTQSGVDFSQGFSSAQASMTFNGSTGLDDSRLQLTNGYTSDTGTAFVTNPLNIQAFRTDFLFQLSNPQADGITFTIQGSKPTALGSYGAGLGYATIPKSIAIKFDFFNDAGEGNDSTGIYTNGAVPTLPAVNLTGSGIVLTSGDSMEAHVTYDGTNLAMTLTDEVTAATWSTVWQANIPQLVGGNTAYIGFTGSTQILTASQKIASWTYTAVKPGQASSTATPVISPAAGTYANQQTITIKDATAGAVIYYSTDGTPASTSASVYTGPFVVSTTTTISVLAMVPGGALSAPTSSAFTIQNPSISYSSGFTTQGLALNGGARVNGTVLQLTDGGTNEARSAYFVSAMNVQRFTTDFDFQLVNAVSDGFTFVIQNQGLTALGSNGAGLGYGVQVNGSGNSISKSVAMKFDIHSNNGEGTDSTGVYLNGASPTVPATNLSNSGIILSSGDVIHAHITYDGTNLTLILTDSTTSATVTEKYAVNIPSTVGANTAYLGFTGGTGGSSATQNIKDWTYAPTVTQTNATAAPVISPGTGTYAAATVVTITDATSGAAIYYTTDGTTPTTGSAVYKGSITVSANETLTAIAQAAGDSLSGTANATFIIQSAAVSDPSGFTAAGLTMNGGAKINGTALEITDGGVNEARSAYFTTPLNVQTFTTDFDFQLVKAVADGFTFVIQNQGLNAVGSYGGGLGYQSIRNSVAIKFDIHSNSGEGPNSTGLYTNGASPTVPATNLSATGVELNSGDVIHAHILYDGKTLTLTLTDATANTTASVAYPVNIPSIVGGNTAYVGFSGGTGGSSATQNILDWTFANAVQAPTLSYANGFQSSSLLLNGGAAVVGTALQLTDGKVNEARSAYFSSPVNVSAFTTTFDLQILNGIADGCTFVIQTQGPNAVGSSGSNLGYGDGITNSVAIKFDIHSNQGEGPDSTGMYKNGATPTIPATNLTSSGVELSSGDVVHVQVAYDGTNLTLTLTDKTTNATFTTTYAVNIPSVVGATTAYVGFTGGTGNSSATQNILDWTYTNP